ncbi:ABC transporter ATP-binding protein [uncultured Fibrobacter sp.]|uniref:ABC transporter ATP-binding protein n=1 Tax=uncultured Fibrobacter sp. TaxID=261512 RepID=UPI0025D1420F|nr:ABC transporter ATP-binding protein [uncultured Fibrobacter sp.]
MAAILLQDVSFRYPGAGAQALSSVNLEIPEGSFFALLGPNGAGKTTLLRLLCGRFAKFDGTVDVAEPLRSGRGVLDMMRCGVLLENPGIYPKLSVEEYLSYFAGFYGMGEGACLPGGSSRERAEMLASRLGLANLNSRMGTLSLGNRQKVQVLRALLPNPKLLILDEPVANLDPVSRECVWKMIEDWRNEEGGTAIVCSHVLAEMEEYATHYAIIDDGRILKAGKAMPDDSCNTDFTVRLTVPVDVAAVNRALEAAGISVGDVSAQKGSLASIYRDTVHK